jgi:hypothetical protein
VKILRPGKTLTDDSGSNRFSVLLDQLPIRLLRKDDLCKDPQPG